MARDTLRKLLETRNRTDFQPEKLEESVKVVADFVSKDGNFLNHLKLKGNITAPNQTTQDQAFSKPHRAATKERSLRHSVAFTF